MQHRTILFVLGLISVPVWGVSLEAQVPARIPERLTLSAARALLAQNSPALLSERLNVEIEAGDVLQAERYVNPSLSFESEGFEFDSNRGSFMDRLKPSFVIRQEILTAGKKAKRVRVERADTEIASIEVEDLSRLLRFQLDESYFSVVLAQKDLEVAEEILNQFERIVELNRIRFESGEISGGELRRTEAAQYQFVAAVVKTQARLSKARIRLLGLIGVTGVEQTFRAVDDFDSDFVPPAWTQLKELALRERPDLAAQRARVVRSLAAIELERAHRVPNITPFLGYNRELDTSGPVFGIDIPLFFFDKNEGKIARAEAERERERLGQRLVEIRVLSEARTALEELTSSRALLAGLEGEFLEKARQARDITESSYRLGEGSLIEFLDAERTYSTTRRLHNATLYEFQIGRARLEMAVGEELP